MSSSDCKVRRAESQRVRAIPLILSRLYPRLCGRRPRPEAGVGRSRELRAGMGDIQDLVGLGKLGRGDLPEPGGTISPVLLPSLPSSSIAPGGASTAGE